ncbi:probable LRR receptor-like serine/threonine-protein kinase At3g47570 [Oryza brachyantha]|uniref:Receptor kinase-like protein Xa21 n=1 Tax=Oryza brachyantha TaxID=4533 RepID=J3MFA4_ORYBR|nr:probable LRR receptor-like serine/threonine-protein kinase At3g47570 [Oryza brachyantha]
MTAARTLSSSLMNATVGYSLWIIFAYASLLHSTTLASGSVTDLQALLCLKRHLISTNDAAALASWNNTNQFCSWPGVTCSSGTPQQASRVTALNLSSHGLDGQIPPCIGNLTSLARIDLSDNKLSGAIPAELGRLRRLVQLLLYSNNLAGVIPNAMSSCASLEHVDLGGNSLGGEIPPDLSNCSNLTRVLLDHNELHGSIPDGFSNLAKLSLLFVPSNNLTGNIPRALGSSSSLTRVILTNNSLTGGIPPLLANSSSLELLDVENNHLSGEIPPALLNSSSLVAINLARNSLSGSVPAFAYNSPLEMLSLSFNHLSGSIPSFADNSSSLRLLLLASNQLEGSIPSSLARIPYLQALDLTYNNLSGAVPDPLYNISTLEYLGMGTNNLVGEIPENIGYSLPSINTIIADENKFHGQIPTSLANATNLQKISLRNNAFTGMIPDFGSLPNLTDVNLGMNQLEAGGWAFLSSLASCTKLVSLRLDANNLQGDLPSSIGSLSQNLQVLVLTGNQISGSIPEEIGNLKSLQLLRLDKNLLTGNIPRSLGNLPNLFVLSLAQNQLSGQIPLSFGNLKTLSELYLQENHLSGSIPAALGQCERLDALNLSCNSFDGTIPREPFTISTLAEVFDLSHNNLSGPIPMEIGGLINLGPLNISNNMLSGEILSTIGECVHLESLHIEGNLLQGRIPSSFASLKGITEMDLSRNNLSGEIPEFFESFGSMVLLNLSFNNLEGPVPSNGVFQNSSEVFLQGNDHLCAISPKLKLPLCHTPAFKRKNASYIAMVVGLSVLSLFSLSSLSMSFLLKRGKERKPVDVPYKELEQLSYFDLVKATDNFSPSNLVGSGNSGSVYVGKFDSQQHVVAIKVFKLDQLGAPKDFISECEALRNTRHRNLVRVITACSTFDLRGHEFKALVLEHMVNGNLESWLHPTSHKNAMRSPLRLSTRIAIAVDIAAALDYLHNRCMPPMVHCDLKPSNVLLDDTMGARVGDFGLAKFLHSSNSSTRDRSTSILGPRGSIGYIAPEYAFGSKISTDGDVYSYGVVILEMLTGKRPTDEMFSDGMNIHKFVEDAFPLNIEGILDQRIMPDYENEDHDDAIDDLDHDSSSMVGTLNCVMKLAKLGLLCSAAAPKDRPTIEGVYKEVTSIKEEFSALRG